MSGEFKKIAVLDNEIEAQHLAGVLEERKIPHLVRSYEAAMFEGIYQADHGWGEIEAPEEHEAEVLEILSDLREPAPEAPEL